MDKKYTIFFVKMNLKLVNIYNNQKHILALMLSYILKTQLNNNKFYKNSEIKKKVNLSLFH